MSRHLFASATTIATALAIACACYFAMFLEVLIFGGGGVGGALTLPMMLFATAAVGMIVSFAVLMPCVSIAELMVSRRSWELPTALVLSLVLCLTFSILNRKGVVFVDGQRAMMRFAGPFGLWMLLSVPLAGYWLCVRSFDAVVNTLFPLFRWLRWKWTMRKLSSFSARS